MLTLIAKNRIDLFGKLNSDLDFIFVKFYLNDALGNVLLMISYVFTFREGI